MFYEDNMEEVLRFGDVVRGYILTKPEMENPIFRVNDKLYNIDVNLAPFSVVLTPCCSIGLQHITLTPLIPVKSERNLFRNPFFAEDMTRLNYEVEPKQSMPPIQWEHLSPQEKDIKLEEGNAYAYLHYFVYEKHEIFPSYTFNVNGTDIETNQYMIDFRRTYTVKCKSIISSDNAPLDSKVLELTLPIRNDLRAKLSYYYGRIPIEDEIY